MNEIFHDDVSISQYVEVHAIREELLSDEDVNEDEEEKKNDKVDAGLDRPDHREKELLERLPTPRELEEAEDAERAQRGECTAAALSILRDKKRRWCADELNNGHDHDHCIKDIKGILHVNSQPKSDGLWLSVVSESGGMKT